MIWIVANKASRVGALLADGHYSRRKVGSPQFMPPGQTLCLVSADGSAVWGWWRPHPSSGIKAMNGLDGWTCTIFRNTGTQKSSDMVLAAEVALAESGVGCGPDGMLTYVWPKKIRSTNPGCCFKVVGWSQRGLSADKRKVLLAKPFALAGVKKRGIRMGELINKTDLEFTDISSEEYRSYTFNSGRKVEIRESVKLHVSESGHRVFASDGTSHYVPLGWIHLEWRAKPGQPSFVR